MGTADVQQILKMSSDRLFQNGLSWSKVFSLIWTWRRTSEGSGKNVPILPPRLKVIDAYLFQRIWRSRQHPTRKGLRKSTVTVENCGSPRLSLQSRMKQSTNGFGTRSKTPSRDQRLASSTMFHMNCPN